MTAVLSTLVQLVAMGALGASVVCMLLGAGLLYLIYRERAIDPVTMSGLTEKISGVKMFMSFTTGFLALGLVFQIINAIVTPKVSVTYVVKPSEVPAQLRNFQPTVMTMVDGQFKEIPATRNIVIDEHDKDVVTFSYEGLIEHLRELQKADTVAQAQTKEAGP
ncbi:hypothetical protein [Paraburkholderia youngii]|uniref:hypothetical protein n=1 Tax=Paraburkholderia youngii TaxID=2782701 RepID=UPI003D1FA88C